MIRHGYGCVLLNLEQGERNCPDIKAKNIWPSLPSQLYFNPIANCDLQYNCSQCDKQVNLGASVSSGHISCYTQYLYKIDVHGLFSVVWSRVKVIYPQKYWNFLF